MSIRRLQIGEKIQPGDMVALPPNGKSEDPYIETFEAGEQSIGHEVNECSRAIYRQLEVNTSSKAFEILRLKIKSLNADNQQKNNLINELKALANKLQQEVLAVESPKYFYSDKYGEAKSDNYYTKANNRIQRLYE